MNIHIVIVRIAAGTVSRVVGIFKQARIFSCRLQSRRRAFQETGLRHISPFRIPSVPCTAMATHILFESASGYAIFEVKQHEEIGAKTKTVQDSIADISKFGKMVNLISFSPFKSAAHALENANDVSEGACSELFEYCSYIN